MTQVVYTPQKWPLAEPFKFAGYTIETLDCVHVTVSRNGKSGQGEGIYPVVFDVTMEQIKADLDRAIAQIENGADAETVCAAMPAGPARNGLDCALWDLRAKESGRSIWALAGLAEGPAAIDVDQTVGLGTIQEMSEAARASNHHILKLKLDGEDIVDRVSAIRKARPGVELIVDANQSWTVELLQRVSGKLAELGVRMIEQPVPPAQDEALAELNNPVPLFADESCHVAADVERLKHLYQGVNIKLDKTGGLTEALALVRAAREAGMGVMVGCMSGTSLSMAPGYVIGSLSDWSDLDGPLQLASDRTPAMQYQNGQLKHYDTALWG